MKPAGRYTPGVGVSRGRNGCSGCKRELFIQHRFGNSFPVDSAPACDKCKMSNHKSIFPGERRIWLLVLYYHTKYFEKEPGFASRGCGCGSNHCRSQDRRKCVESRSAFPGNYFCFSRYLRRCSNLHQGGPSGECGYSTENVCYGDWFVLSLDPPQYGPSDLEPQVRRNYWMLGEVA